MNLNAFRMVWGCRNESTSFYIIFLLRNLNNCSNGHLQPQDRFRHVFKLKEWFISGNNDCLRALKVSKYNGAFYLAFPFFSTFHLCSPADTGIMRLRCGYRGGWFVNQRSNCTGTFLDSCQVPCRCVTT